MRKIKVSSLLYLVVSLLLSHSISAQDGYIDGTPFESGQNLKKGFFWYDDKVIKPDVIDESEPSQPKQPQDENVTLDSKWLKENMPKLLFNAMDNPTPENLSRYYTASRLMVDIGTRFSDKSKDYFLKNPLMSEKRRQPIEKVALDAHRATVERNQQNVLVEIFDKAGLWFFFQSTCQYCMEESQILNFMQNYYKADILPISVDGRPLPNGAFSNFVIPTPHIMTSYKVKEVPTIYLVSKDGTSSQKISEGLISAEELKNTIILAAKSMNVIDDITFQSTLDIKRQYTIGETGVITVDKKTFESDPYLLQRVMEQEIEKYTMPTTESVQFDNRSEGYEAFNGYGKASDDVGQNRGVIYAH